MERYDGDSPINARIKIDYSKEKPKVSFAYPRKKSQMKGSMLTPVFMIWTITSFIFLMIFINNYSEPNESYKSYMEYNVSNYSDFLDYYLQEERLDYYYEYYKAPVLVSFKDIFSFRQFMTFVIVFFGWIPIYFPLKKKLDKLYPDYQALTSSKKIARFRKEDVKKVNYLKYPYYVELPVFSNVVCDFNATEDFSKYMKEFEIKEHKFVYYQRKKVKIGKKKRKEHKVNEWLWYARWYFSDKPIKGELEVIFK